MYYTCTALAGLVGRAPGRTEPGRERGKVGRARGPRRTNATDARIPGHGMEPAVRDPYTCDWTKLGLELDYEG